MRENRNCTPISSTQNWQGRKCGIEYERLADAVGFWQAGNGKLSRDRTREIATRLGTELTESELDDLYETACGFLGDVWEYHGSDAAGLWMVASSLPAGVRLEVDGVREGEGGAGGFGD